MIIDSFSGEYEFLSNFYPTILSIDGVSYMNSEAAFQAYKLKDPSHRKIFSKLAPGTAKRLGRTVEMREDWDEIRIDVMRRVVDAKFSQNYYLRARLLATGDTELIEGNKWHDQFWGVSDGFGENNLGKILMELRTKYQEENNHE